MSSGEDPIFFTVISAKGLEAGPECGTYVIVSIGTQMLFRTRSEIGESPQWNETYPINVSGPRSYAIAVHRESPAADTLLGEITNIIVDSGPQELTVPIESLTGSRPIIVTVSIRHLEDMLVLGDNSNNHQKRLIRLSNFIIKSFSDNHLDLSHSARLSVAIVVNGNSLCETTPVKKEPSESQWNCGGKIMLSSGMAYTLQVNDGTALKKHLGFVQLDRDVLRNWQIDSRDEFRGEHVLLSGIKGLSLEESSRYTRPVSPPSDTLPIPIYAPIPHEATEIYLSAHEDEIGYSGDASGTPAHKKHVRQKMVPYSDDGLQLEILFTVQDLCCISDSLGQDWGSIAHSSGLPHVVSIMDHVLDSHETRVVPLSSRQSTPSHHLSSTLKGSNISDVPSHQITGSLSNEPSQAIGMAAVGVQLLGAIPMFQDTRDFPPGGNQDKAFNLGPSKMQGDRLGEISGWEKAISALEIAIELTPIRNPKKAWYLNKLGTSYLGQFQRLGDISDLEKAISALEDAVELTPTGDSTKAGYLNNLGSVYQTQFERVRDIPILEKAISALEKAAELTPTGHPNKALCLSNLCNSYQSLFERLGKISDLEKAISTLEKAVELTPPDHPNKALHLSDLGNSYHSQFERQGEISDLKKAISAKEKAVEHTPTGHPDKAMHLNTLGVSYQSQFERLGAISDLEKAISVKEKAVELTPTGHPNKAIYLNNLGSSYQWQFKRLGELSDLEKAISALEQAVELTSTGHPNKAGYLNNLGNSYQSQFERLGEISYLEKAIYAKEKAVELIPADHPNKAIYINNLGSSYQGRFERLGEIPDLEKAISALEQAVELTSTGHPNKSGYLNNLGSSYQSQFERLGEISDLEKAISAKEKAVELTPADHPNKAIYLNNLGSSYQSQFKRLGEISDLEEVGDIPILGKAISALEKACELIPTDHPGKPLYLSNLGDSYQSRFERLGEISDLENAISAKEKAVELTSTGHPNKSGYLNSLGSSYQSQFERLGEISDLQKAISAKEKAVELTPADHPNKAMYLNNLSNSYHSQFERLGEISDLEKAISASENSVELTPSGHPNKAMHLHNLSNSYHSQFEKLGEISDLEKAISAKEKAVELTPTGHPSKPMYLSLLGNSYQSLFERLGEISDLEKAISVKEKAVELTPTGHPHKAAYLYNLGRSYKSQFERLEDPFIIRMAIKSFSQASQIPTSPPLTRFNAGLLWAHCAEIAGLSPIKAYSHVLHLLPHVAWIGLTILHRYTLLSDICSVVHDAADIAILSGYHEMALEWLEQGRSIVWGQLLHLRTPVDELLVIEPELGTQLLAVSQALDKVSAREGDLQSSLSAAQIAKNHHVLASQWDELIQKVHLVPGFEGFLQPKTVSQLIPAAKLGPVIVITINHGGCHALALQSTSDGHTPMHEPATNNHLHSTQNTPLNSNVAHIPLPHFSYDKAQDMHSALKKLCRSRFARVAVFEYDNQISQSTFEEILSDLWTLVVLPILHALAFSAPKHGNLPHIWWCPTGPLAFLPIHAAGIYNTEEHGHKLSDFAISSYTPTITALLNTKLNSPSMPFKILAIGQASNPSASPLPNTDTELEILKGHAGQLHVETLKGVQAKVNDVIQEMSESTWVHLACHGTQNPSDPTKSAFILADGNLELSRITRLSLPQAEFAFLSACQTATGNATVQEEAVHLAAGMLMAGYQSVIATMWAIVDKDAPQVADDVYAEILRNGQPDCTRAAYALHHATQNLRCRGAPFRSWVPFIHLGR